MTGGAGFIGSHLVQALVEQGDQVRVLDDLSTGRLENLDGCRRSSLLDTVIGSVRDPAVVRRALDGCAEVFHLAASVGVGMITSNPSECLRNNVEGVQNLFAAAAELKAPPGIVLFSSSEVYGKSTAIPLREDGDLVLGPSAVPRWSYASGKAMGEFLALGEHARTGIPVVIVRCFNTCGPRQQPTYGMVVPRFLDQALRNEPLTIYGDGKQTRCFSFVDDVVRMVLALAASPRAVGQVFNIGTDRETSISELAEKVLEVTGSRAGIRFIPYSEAYGNGFQDVVRRVPDLTKISRVIGRPAVTDLDAMLRITLEHRRSLLPPVTGAAAPMAPAAGSAAGS